MKLKAVLKDTFLGADERAAKCADVVPYSLTRPEGERHYLMAAPSQAPTHKCPLVIVIHGGGASARQVLGMAFPPSPLSVWLEIAEREQLVVVAPDAGKGGWSDCLASTAQVANKDDVAFIGALIDKTIAEHAVDPGRVYVIGVSRGGFMAYRLALELTTKLAAFSAVLASMPPAGKVTLPATPLSALIFGCTADPLIPYHGGKFFYTPLPRVSSIEDSARIWREHCGLADRPAVHAIPPVSGGARSHATAYLWGAAADCLQVGLYKIANAGHAEPSGRKRYPRLINWLVGPQNTDFEVADAAWEFFRHKRAGLTGGDARFDDQVEGSDLTKNATTSELKLR